jgi:formylglycine-generating enzyme required for sulfatase activity
VSEEPVTGIANSFQVSQPNEILNVRIILSIIGSMLLIAFAGSVARADIIESIGSGANQFNMTFVPIGNPGNAADTTGSPNPAGSVGYHYNMGKYEVSRDMINKANAAGNLGITLADMTSWGGNGVNRPATGVSWNEAARYVNWLNMSQGYSLAYKFDFQPGQGGYSSNAQIQLWQISDAGYNAANQFRNSQAKYFLPSMDEWYKAAYYDPNANGGAGGYWNFPTGSDTAPTPVSGGTTAGTAVYDGQPGPGDIDNAGGLSPYGVMGLGGNVFEWEETTLNLLNNNPSSSRGVRGGHWGVASINLSASLWGGIDPTNAGSGYGFRVASIPEPSSASLLMLASVGLWQRRKRTR